MIQIDREIRDSGILSWRAFEMRVGAAAEAIDCDFVGADCATAAIEIADFYFDRSGVGTGIAEVALD